MATLVTLREIWEAPASELKQLLESGGFASTSLLEDRILAAQIYHDAGLLTPEETELVEHPGFASTMGTTPTLEQGLTILKRDLFQRKLLYLHAGIDLVGASGAFGDADPMDTYWNVLRNSLGDDTLRDVNGAVMENAVDDITDVFEAAEGDVAAAATPVWKWVIANRDRIAKVVNTVEVKSAKLDSAVLFRRLLGAVDLTRLVPVARCYYLYSLSELLPYIENNDELRALLWDQVMLHGCAQLWELVVLRADISGAIQTFLPDLAGIVEGFTDYKPKPRDVAIALLLQM